MDPARDRYYNQYYRMPFSTLKMQNANASAYTDRATVGSGIPLNNHNMRETRSTSNDSQPTIGSYPDPVWSNRYYIPLNKDNFTDGSNASFLGLDLNFWILLLIVTVLVLLLYKNHGLQCMISSLLCSQNMSTGPPMSNADRALSDEIASLKERLNEMQLAQGRQ